MFFCILYYILLFFQKLNKLVFEARMKKFYCFYCQENIKPHGFLMFRYCPNCRRRITDKGEGFYKVCDICNANLPADADKCLRCGYNFNKDHAIDNFVASRFLDKNTWLGWLLVCLALFLGIIVTLGVLYISFYIAGIVLLIVFFAFLFNILRAWLHI